MSDITKFFIHQKLKIIKIDEKKEQKETAEEATTTARATTAGATTAGATATPESFQVMFNPSHYQEKFGVEVVSKTLVDGSEYLDYKQLQDQTLEFELLFDESYVNEYVWRRKIGKKNFDSVAKQIENFKKVTGYPLPKGQINPNPLKLQWGNNHFKNDQFILQSLVLNYTLFDRSGNPIRAKANAIFRRVNTLESSDESGNSTSSSESASKSELVLKIGK